MKDSIADLIELGSNEELLKFLKEKNIFDKSIFNFDKIYPFLHDVGFYKSVMEILRYLIEGYF